MPNRETTGLCAFNRLLCVLLGFQSILAHFIGVCHLKLAFVKMWPCENVASCFDAKYNKCVTSPKKIQTQTIENLPSFGCPGPKEKEECWCPTPQLPSLVQIRWRRHLLKGFLEDMGIANLQDDQILIAHRLGIYVEGKNGGTTVVRATHRVSCSCRKWWLGVEFSRDQLHIELDVLFQLELYVFGSN